MLLFLLSEKNSKLLTVQFFHHGELKKEPYPHYEGGETSVYDHIDCSALLLAHLRIMCDATSGNKGGGTKFFCINEGVEEGDFHEVITDTKLQELYRDALAGDRLLILYDYPVNDVVDETTGEDAESESDSDSSDGDWDEKDSEYDQEESENDYDFAADDNGGVEGPKKHEASTLSAGAKKLSNSSVGAKKVQPTSLSKAYKYDEGNYDDNSGSELEPDSEEDLQSIQGSDPEDVDMPMLFHPKDMDKPPLRCGLTFSSQAECKEAIRHWNIRRGKRWRFKKDDKHRIKVICPEKYKKDHKSKTLKQCDWMIYVSIYNESPIVTTLVTRHKCKFRQRNKSVTSVIAGRICSQLVKDNQIITTIDYKRLAKEKYKSILTKSQAYRARRKSMRIVYGNVEDQPPGRPKSTKRKKSVSERIIEVDGKQKRSHNQRRRPFIDPPEGIVDLGSNVDDLFDAVNLGANTDVSSPGKRKLGDPDESNCERLVFMKAMLRRKKGHQSGSLLGGIHKAKPEALRRSPRKTQAASSSQPIQIPENVKIEKEKGQGRQQSLSQPIKILKNVQIKKDIKKGKQKTDNKEQQDAEPDVMFLDDPVHQVKQLQGEATSYGVCSMAEG
ncbi:OLC1v1019611C1 [Oldenlandia corymbosa var. corymbosa]|uniref:OLC1v1019611C1 n=1 Tax=Oldenlandia corymbosa var. corymbosa TaxID=529605 RepID=A0AAV1EEG6_OLDCO|nr:OLC1v1019611C1 [Oldenlandia corymbosa var. corymbosa]